jgi:GNAT superfamily N-acetyltransferase
MIERLQASGVSNIFIAFFDGKPCGMVSFGKSCDSDLSEYAEIIAIYALESYWGLGVGGRLMGFALSELKQLGYKMCCYGRSKPMYGRSGFMKKTD